MTSADYNELVSKKISGDASLEDVAKIEKFQVQRSYEKPIDSEFIKEFNQKKRAIYNRSFMKAFPDENVRREIDLHRMDMRETVDDFRMDTKYSIELINTLKYIGFKRIGDKNIKIDIHDLSVDKMNEIRKCVEYIRISDMGRATRGECPIKRFQYHLNSILGYKFNRHQKQVNKKIYHVYSLKDDIKEKYLDNKIYHDDWLNKHVRRTRIFSDNDKGEFKTIHIDSLNQKRKDILDIEHISKKMKHSFDLEYFNFKPT